jgi:uncharacterized protein
MAHNFKAIAFTPEVQALQEKHGSRKQYDRLIGVATPDRISALERDFIATRDSFYIASVIANGWPYMQHRGGAPGFLKVIDETTLAFADFRGNKQYVTAGNLATENRVTLFLMDYPSQSRMKILGRAEVVEPDVNPERFQQLLPMVREEGYNAVVEQIFVIHVEAIEWNCQQHITPRYTAEQVNKAVEPLQQRLEQLEEENAKLREKLDTKSASNSGN